MTTTSGGTGTGTAGGPYYLPQLARPEASRNGLEAPFWEATERDELVVQRCSSCGYDNGTNEQLRAAVPYYNYAVVINTPSGAAAYPHGSAFFLHVTDGRATAGCVAIPQSKLVTLMRWLHPATHPRILIGVP